MAGRPDDAANDRDGPDRVDAADSVVVVIDVGPSVRWFVVLRDSRCCSLVRWAIVTLSQQQ